MPREPRKYLIDVIEAIDFLRNHVRAGTLEEYLGDEFLRAAVERKLMIAGEAFYKLSRIAPELLVGISECERIIGFRHILVHAYFELDHEIVWSILNQKLGTLRNAVDRALASADHPPSDPD